jgi:putative membrane protein
MKDVFAHIIGLVHIFAFLVEAVFWKQPWVQKMYRISPEESKANELMALNLGFYNLFIATAVYAGLIIESQNVHIQGRLLVDYAAFSALGAGLVLLFSHRKMWRGAVIQSGPAVFYFLLRWI